MLNEFKDFILKGNVVELAIAIVMGVAFGAVVNSLVTNILTPIIAIPGSTDFSALSITISDSRLFYGAFLNSVISFLMVAGAVFFFVIKPLNAVIAKRQSEPDPESSTKACSECLSSIPKEAKRCSFCTSPQ